MPSAGLGGIALDALALGAVAEELGPQLGKLGLRARAIAGISASTRFSGMNRPANTTSGSASAGARGSSEPAYSPSSTVTSPR